MNRMTAYLLAALIAATPLSATAQDRGRGNDRPDRGERERPREQQDERPRVSMGDITQRVSAGRPGRYLGASDRGGMIVVRWEYPGGREADIMVDGRTGRVMGER